MLAVCPNSPELHLYANCLDPDPANWRKVRVLRQHDLVISGVDWSAATNRIVTCSHDRSAFVWNLVEGEEAAALQAKQLVEPAAAGGGGGGAGAGVPAMAGVVRAAVSAAKAGGGSNAAAAAAASARPSAWKPQVVVLNIPRAALDVKWSPDGQKFAVASSAKVVMVCSFDAANDWWISKPSKKHKSTALAVAFHPNGQLLASVATDYRCRVISAFLEDVDTGGPDGAQFGGAALPEVGEVVAEFEVTRAWLNDCAWSPSGASLAFVGHDSLLHVVSYPAAGGGGGGAGAAGGDGEPIVQSIKCPTLPGMRVLFLSESLLVTCGHGMNPELFLRGAPAADGAPPAWGFACYLDRRGASADAAKAKAAAAGAAGAASGWASARAMFASKVNKGQAAGSGAEDPWTRHTNAITYLQPYRAAATAAPATRAFSTSGVDGRVVVWDLVDIAPPELDLRAAGLVD